MTVNDYKLESLIRILEKSGGHIDDLDYELLAKQVEVNEEQINDMWYTYLSSVWGLSGHINDMYREFFILNGLTGHINDMWKDFWESLLDLSPPPRVPYEFELPLGIETYEFEDFEDYQFQLSVI